MLEKINYDFLSQMKKSVTLELTLAYKDLPFLQGEHPKLLFGDDLSGLSKS